MLASTKRPINHVLRPVGHIITHEPCLPVWQRFFAVLRANSLTPQTVFDIGVPEGWLYGASPEAFYYLVDPTSESLPYMQRWAESLRAEVLNVAFGASDGTEVIDVRDEIGGSTFFREVGSYTSGAKYKVPVQLFDAIIGDFKRPAPRKVDVQGAELMIPEVIPSRSHNVNFTVIAVSALVTVIVLRRSFI